MTLDKNARIIAWPEAYRLFQTELNPAARAQAGASQTSTAITKTNSVNDRGLDDSVMTTSTRSNSRKIFSPLVLSRIAERVDQGFSAAEIADEIGCKLGSLRVRCSEHGISLRRAARYASDRRERRERMVINISRSTALALQQQAGNDQMSAAQFAAVLLEAVVRDDLYEAVIDRDRIEPAAGSRAGSVFTHVGNQVVAQSRSKDRRRKG
jgi:hypothetical protein